MQLSNVEASVCIKALQLAARWEARAGDHDMAEGFAEMRRTLFERYCVENRKGPDDFDFDEAESLGLDGTGRFEMPAPRTARGSVQVEGSLDD